MPIQLIADRFGIDAEDAIEVGKNTTEIDALRLFVHEHLAQKNPDLLRLRFTKIGLIKHFKHLEGMDDVLPTRTLLPRLLLAERLKTQVPRWLTDDWIVQLDLLKKITFVETTNDQPFEVFVLIACHSDLLTSTDFYAFINALRQQSTPFLTLLGIENIRTRLTSHLVIDLEFNAEIAQIFIETLAKSTEINLFLQNFSYQQHTQLLRQTLVYYGLVFALPAQTIPINVLTAFPLLPLSEKQARQLPSVLLDIIRLVVRKILHKELSPDTLAEFIIADWPGLWTELAHLYEESPLLMTQELANQCQRFESEPAQVFVKKIEHYLVSSQYQVLSTTASVEDTLDWSVGYFNYLRSVLLSKQSLDETINGSFTAWLISQSSRISRSDSDWRFCSKQINHYLADGYLVFVTVIDALSALNQDILLEELKTIDQLMVISDTLFAPLPTLTEIGKMAVLTGKQTYLLPNTQEAALQQTFKAHLPNEKALNVIKSWNEPSEHITEQTNLVVFFENRLDERLHKATSFSKHRDDITPIVRGLKRSIQGWLKDAAHRDVVFFITADHGMTVTNGLYAGEPLGETKDRVFKLKNNEDIPADFVLVNQDSKDRYAVPKTRIGLTDAALAHGGLTPEEVLIPFITLKRPSYAPNKLPVEVEIVGGCLCLADKFWQFELRLKADVQVEMVRLNLELPFILEGNLPIDIIRANKSHTITLKFRAAYEQEGLIALELGLQYDRDGVHEKNSKRLEICFPASLLERDIQTKSFEDMF